MSAGPLLILFGREPRPGEVKTRLCPPLSPEEAAALYEAFLADVCAGALRLQASLGCAVRLALAGPPGAASGSKMGVPLVPQRGAGLGERMEQAFREGFAEGHGPIVLRNSDSPELEDARLQEAFALLEMGSDLVLGPDLGGGYYLIGLRELLPSLFQTPALGDHGEGGSVFGWTLGQALALGLRASVLPRAPDVDLPADLEALRRRLEDSPQRAPNTAKWLHGGHR
ncbi:MAG TPA: glycosyltransferase [Planctomycetes bacterium]|nr:glycosyltransferase [Planctomycetota bacterium]